MPNYQVLVYNDRFDILDRWTFSLDCPSSDIFGVRCCATQQSRPIPATEACSQTVIDRYLVFFVFFIILKLLSCSLPAVTQIRGDQAGPLPAGHFDSDSVIIFCHRFHILNFDCSQGVGLPDQGENCIERTIAMMF